MIPEFETTLIASCPSCKTPVEAGLFSTFLFAHKPTKLDAQTERREGALFCHHCKKDFVLRVESAMVHKTMVRRTTCDSSSAGAPTVKTDELTDKTGYKLSPGHKHIGMHIWLIGGLLKNDLGWQNCVIVLTDQKDMAEAMRKATEALSVGSLRNRLDAIVGPRKVEITYGGTVDA